MNRDSEDSAPAEYPPEQPEADTLEDDADAYGAEEAEMQAALERELAETEAAAAQRGEKGEDHDMEGTEEVAVKTRDDEDDDASDAGSEDLEAESSGSDDELEEEEEAGEAGEGEDMEMGDAEEKAADAKTNGEQKPVQSAEVMVH
jgi:histone chaperone ASF1